MTTLPGAPGRRERAKEDKRRRIMDAARTLFAERGVGGVTTQQIAERADVAIGTLFLYASTKAELLILVQNQKFAAAIDDGLRAAAAAVRAKVGTVASVSALVEPVVTCIREQPENGRTYLHEILFGDPTEPHRREGLTLALRLEDGIAGILAHDPAIAIDDTVTLARVVTAIIHVTTTATVNLQGSLAEILDQIRRQVTVILPEGVRTV